MTNEKYSREWEKINDDTFRLKVPHGWLVALYIVTAVAASFVYDEKHEWILEDKND